MPLKVNFTGMKDYFIRLLNYDAETNRVMLKMIQKAGNPEKPLKLMAHLLAAQRVWLNRCKGLPAPPGALWPGWAVEEMERINQENSEEWLSFLATLQAGDFSKIISYKTLKGDPFENRLEDILAHMINHGTHHRAQAGQHLVLAGIENLPVTDYIFYLRERG